jgi:polyisoprenoid-binding protein YceI
MTTTSIPTGTWTLDPAHSDVGFSVRHAGISKVRGKFDVVSGTVEFDGENVSSVTAVADASTFNSGNADRDAHVRSADFFDVENYPEITFESTEVRVDGDDVVIDGNLTIRGETRPVSFAGEIGGVAVDPFGNERLGAEASTAISRKDFGLTWNAALETGGVLVGDKVQINLELSFIRAANEAKGEAKVEAAAEAEDSITE